MTPDFNKLKESGAQGLSAFSSFELAYAKCISQKQLDFKGQVAKESNAAGEQKRIPRESSKQRQSSIARFLEEEKQ